MTVSRRQAREWAIQMLTAADINPPEDIDGFIAESWETVAEAAGTEGVPLRIPEKYRAFAEDRVRGVLAARESIDAILAPLLENWELYRLGTVERQVLRMGIWEMTASDVPPAVVINEAVDLVNWFSVPASRSLVNGVLDRFAKTRKTTA